MKDKQFRTLWLRPCLFCVLTLVCAGWSTNSILEEVGYAVQRATSWNGRSYFSEGNHVDGIRDVLEREVQESSSVLIVSSSDKRLHSLDRCIAQAVLWCRMPASVILGPMVISDDYDAYVIPSSINILELTRLHETGCQFVEKVGSRSIWTKERDGNISHEEAPSREKECVGVLFVLLAATIAFMTLGFSGFVFFLVLFSALLTLLCMTGIPLNRVSVVLLVVGSMSGSVWCFPQKKQRSQRGHLFLELSFWVLPICIFAFLSFLALTHTFTTPNGLAVIGGKAKLWYLSGGFPSGYFTDSAWRLTEPAYPPGMASLVLGCYAMAGGCGEWLTQLVGCAAMAVLLGAVLDGCCRNSEFGRFARVVAAIWILSLFLDPVPLKMGSLLYPEPLMALCVVIGWRRVWRDGHREDWMGWFLLGASGWFKNEGVVFAIAAWLVRLAFVVFSDRLPNRSKFQAAARLVSALAIALALPVAWHAGVRMAGGGLNDFAPLWQPEIMRGMKVLSYSFRLAFLAPWHYAFAYPAIAIATGWSIAGIANKMRRRRTGSSTGLVVSDENRLHLDRNDCRVLRALFFALFCLAAFVWILACSRAPDFEWHMVTSIPRLLWTPALIIVLELASLDPPGNTEET